MRKLLALIFICMISVTSCTGQGVTLHEETSSGSVTPTAAAEEITDGSFLADIRLEGGSGKAHIQSPVTVNVKDGEMSAVLVWSSKNYDYMIVDGVRYDNETPGAESTFTIPVKSIDEPLKVIADTVAMSTPHEIEYIIYWERDNADPAEEGSYDIPAAGFNEVTLPGLTKTGEIDLQYAEMFKISEYGALKLISIYGGGNYLLLPDQADIPKDLPDDIVLIRRAPHNVYLASTSAMDLVRAAGALGNIRMCSTDANGWYVDEAKAAIENGSMLYVGKYRAPDYETIISNGCDLAIENTMIYHEPSVKEKLEELGIPVMVEMSSYESHPLGRLEWIRLYGVLFDRQEEADAFYKEQLAQTEPVMSKPSAGKSVAFFHVTASGMINIRKPGDYISRMIELSGGDYIIEAGENEGAVMSTMNIQMEDFYLKAKDADILIYNSTIGGEIGSLQELLAKNELFADFKAVREGQVYCTTRNFFQQTTGMAQFMSDLDAIYTGSGEDTVFLNRLK